MRENMSSVGAVGGVGSAGGGGAGGAGSVSGPSGGAGVGAAEGAGGAGAAGSIKNDDTSAVEKCGDGGNISQTENNYYNSFNNSMSTQDHLHLQDTAVGACGSPEGGELDIKKLMEMMMAIKLLQEMNKMLEGDGSSSGGFSAMG